jgi:hypothetical protein
MPLSQTSRYALPGGDRRVERENHAAPAALLAPGTKNANFSTRGKYYPEEYSALPIQFVHAALYEKIPPKE